MKHWIIIAAALLAASAGARADNGVPPVVRAAVGTTVEAVDHSLTLRLVDKKQNYSYARSMAQYRDSAVNSPKSVNIHPDGTKFYVNSLEGCATVVYDMATRKQLKVIAHRFGPADAHLWAPSSGLFHFTHYTSRDVRCFSGKPVESTFTHGGRYLWVPYYRRDFDLNAQDPSAVAVIDTRSDEIVRLFDTGPLPKMIACSHDGRTVAVTHWGNNTVGLLDIAGQDPASWKYVACVPAPTELKLDFSLTQPVNRDSHSGLLLRGTVFMPGDKHLLVSSMNGGGIGVIDVPARRYLGRITGSATPRHLVIAGDYLYLSSNTQGLVQRIALSAIGQAIERLERDGGTASLGGWEQCRVGGGARTLEVSPSGRYAFVACNTASSLCVVDTRSMTMIAQIDVDSYPVGLALSDDGRTVIVTSQGRKGNGGNAVNIYSVDYREPEPVRQRATPAAAPPDSVVAAPAATPAAPSSGLPWIAVAGVAAVLLLAAVVALRHRRKP